VKSELSAWGHVRPAQHAPASRSPPAERDPCLGGGDFAMTRSQWLIGRRCRGPAARCITMAGIHRRLARHLVFTDHPGAPFLAAPTAMD
jgi:hypothetical protein